MYACNVLKETNEKKKTDKNVEANRLTYGTWYTYAYAYMECFGLLLYKYLCLYQFCLQSFKDRLLMDKQSKKKRRKSCLGLFL